MAIVLFDNHNRQHLYPLSFTNAVADLRLGIFTFKERWEKLSGEKVFIHTDAYLQHLYEPIPDGTHTWIDASSLPNEALTQSILSLRDNTAIKDDEGFIAGRNNIQPQISTENIITFFTDIHHVASIKRLQTPWEIFLSNDEILRNDFTLITKGRTSAKPDASNSIIGNGDLFIEEGAQVQHAIINTSKGPVYIGKNTEIMEGACIRGPFALCDNAVVKMGAKIYGSTTIGPCCVAGGELKNVVMQSHSNKAHDGYLGDSVIGKWCNLGAGTSNSNVKNTASNVKAWSYAMQSLVEIGIKCGLVMGDFTRTAINTSINTGSVIGTCCNVFGDGFSPKYMPNFTWGNKGITKYEFDKALKDIDNWKKMKDDGLTTAETTVLKYIFDNFYK